VDNSIDTTQLDPPTTPPPPLELEAGWTIRVTYAMNIAILRLVRPDGGDAHISFARGCEPKSEPVAINALSEIHEPALRTAAEETLTAHAGRVAKANKAVADFNGLVPPTRLAFLTSWLATLHIEVEFSIDDDELTVILTLAAVGEAAGTLLTLIGRWREACATECEGVDAELEDDALKAQLPQYAAADFLTWLSETEIGY
jgi:hypothetical protein